MNKIEKYTVFRSIDDGKVYVTRNIVPMFTARYTTGSGSSNIVFTDFVNAIQPDPIRLAKMMRGIGEAIARFLNNEAHERRKTR